MRLTFNHIHQGKMFTFLDLEYNPERLIRKLKDKCLLLADMYDLNVKFSEHNRFDYQIKLSDIYKCLDIIFERDDLNLRLEFNLQIPDVRNSFCTVSGVRRYIQKQICDTCFISLKSTTKEKAICELARSFTLILSQQKPPRYEFSVQEMSYVEAVGLYILLGGNPEKLKKLDDPIVEHFLELYNSKKENEILGLINPSMSTNQKKKLIAYVNTYYKISDLLHLFFDDSSDIIYKLILNIEHLDDEQGLDLRNRRIRTSEEMVATAFLSKIIDFILDSIFIANKNRRQKQVSMEPFETLYDFVLVENMFEAPLASVANRARCTIVGNKGFTKGGIPVKIKDIHPTQYNCLDPAVTPDRDSAGVVLYLATTSKLDEVGMFEIKDNILKIMEGS